MIRKPSNGWTRSKMKASKNHLMGPSDLGVGARNGAAEWRTGFVRFCAMTRKLCK
jgi:hypothetical protein